VFARPRSEIVRTLVLLANLLQACSSVETASVVGTAAESPQEAVLRAIAAEDESPYFVAYCVAMIPGEASPALTRDDRVKRAWGVETPDIPKALLERLGGLPHRFVPASECMKTDGDYDVVLRSTKKRPALLIGVGPIQVISQDHVQVDVFTTSGGLTETVTAYSLTRGSDRRWRITSEEILLQV
jgi:hypothetical protein